MKFVYKDQCRDQQNVALIHRWPLYAGSIAWGIYSCGPVKCGLYKQVVFTAGLNTYYNKSTEWPQHDIEAQECKYFGPTPAGVHVECPETHLNTYITADLYAFIPVRIAQPPPPPPPHPLRSYLLYLLYNGLTRWHHMYYYRSTDTMAGPKTQTVQDVPSFRLQSKLAW